MRKLIFALLALFSTACSTGTVFKVSTLSMAPTIKPGDVVSIDPVAYKLGGLQRFDIVVVEDPDKKQDAKGQTEVYVKRIVALGGETIEIKGHQFYINGQQVSIPFVVEDPKVIEDYGPVTVPKGEYFLIGDNLGNSLDSRTWNPPTVKPDAIRGKVTVIKDGATGKMRGL
jgi:signal peptidase I